MSRRAVADPAARLLKSLEARLVALDEDLLLATAFCAAPPPVSFLQPPQPAPRPRARRRLDFHAVAQPPRRVPRRLRFAPLPPEVDRVVIQNWNAETGFVPVGDAEIELDPGQAVTLWINRAAATPVGQGGGEFNSSIVILAPDEQLIA